MSFLALLSCSSIEQRLRVAKATGQALADMSSDLSFESLGAWASAARESIELARISPKSPSGFLKEQSELEFIWKTHIVLRKFK